MVDNEIYEGEEKLGEGDGDMTVEPVDWRDGRKGGFVSKWGGLKGSSWNVRGANIEKLCTLLDSSAYDFCCIQETHNALARSDGDLYMGTGYRVYE